MDKKTLFSLVSGIGLLSLAAKSERQNNVYFKKIKEDLDKAEQMYMMERSPDEIVAQFSRAQDQIHSPIFNKLSVSQQSKLANQYLSLGNRMMEER
jgi:hypothetical protein